MTDQKPIARVTGYHGGHCIVVPTDPARLLQMNMALYAAPQPADPAPHDAQSELTDDELWEAIEVGRQDFHSRIRGQDAAFDDLDYCVGRAVASAARSSAQSELPSAPVAIPLTDEQIEQLREKTFSTSNPFCPVDSKSMRKAVRAAEFAHGIGQAAVSRTSDRDAIRDATLDEVANSFLYTFGPNDRLDPKYIADCILSHKSIRALQSGEGKS